MSVALATGVQAPRAGLATSACAATRTARTTDGCPGREQRRLEPNALAVSDRRARAAVWIGSTELDLRPEPRRPLSCSATPKRSYESAWLVVSSASLLQYRDDPIAQHLGDGLRQRLRLDGRQRRPAGSSRRTAVGLDRHRSPRTRRRTARRTAGCHGREVGTSRPAVAQSSGASCSATASRRALRRSTRADSRRRGTAGSRVREPNVGGGWTHWIAPGHEGIVTPSAKRVPHTESPSAGPGSCW